MAIGAAVELVTKMRKGIAGHIDQFATDAVALLTNALADYNEAPGGFPVVQTQLKLTDRIVFIHCSPLLDLLRLAFDPWGEPGHYNIWQTALLQKCQQLVIEEPGIGSQQANLLALLP